MNGLETGTRTRSRTEGARRAAEGAGSSRVLVVNGEDWAGRSFESLLAAVGHRVCRARTGRDALDLAARIRPDAIVTEPGSTLPDMTGEELCRALRALPEVGPATPILVLSTEPVGRRSRMAMLKAGAWDVSDAPCGFAELVARVETYVAVRRDIRRARQGVDRDASTGLYNLEGVRRRSAEMAMDAARAGRALGWVALGADPAHSPRRSDLPEGSPRVLAVVVRGIAKVLASSVRPSDIVARVDEADFVVVVPGADPPATEALARRLLAAVEGRIAGKGWRGIRLSAGHWAATDAARARPRHRIGETGLARAFAALQAARGRGAGAPVPAP